MTGERFSGNHSETSDRLKGLGFKFNEDFSYSGTLGDPANGKKRKNYIHFQNEKCREAYYNKTEV